MSQSAQEQSDASDLSSAASQTISLVKRAKAGSRTAFHQLVDIYQNAIFRMVYYRTRSRMDADDLTQDIFLQAFKNLSRLKAAESFRSWLFSIALNKIRDFHRKRLFRSMFKASSDNVDLEHGPDTDDNPEALEHLARQDFWRQIGEILKKLSPMEREVFLLRFFDNLSIKEITEAMGKGESTVKTHLYRALKKIREDSLALSLLEYKQQ